MKYNLFDEANTYGTNLMTYVSDEEANQNYDIDNRGPVYNQRLRNFIGRK